MKNKKIFLNSLLLLFLVTLIACQDDNNVFDKSPSERQQAYFDKCQETLVNAPNGWVMQYFFNPDSGGVNLLASFDADNTVNMAGKTKFNKNVFTESNSRYNFVTENGTSIHFTSYNDILHPFADPDPTSGGDKYGDFEFVITGVTDQIISLKGKRTGLNINLNQIPEGVSKENYFDSLEGMRSTLFYKKSPNLLLSTGDKKYIFSNGQSSVFSVVAEGEKSEELKLPFIITDKGLYLYAGEEFSGSNTQEFVLNQEKTELISLENPKIKLTAVNNLVEYFDSNQSIDWKFDLENMSDELKVLYERISQSVYDKFTNVTKVDLFFGNRTSAGRAFYGVGIIITRKTGVIDGIMTLKKTIESGGDIVGLQSTAESGTNNGKSFYNGNQTIDGFKDFVDLFSGDFLLSTPTPINPINIKFVSQQNPTLWFVAKK